MQFITEFFSRQFLATNRTSSIFLPVYRTSFLYGFSAPNSGTCVTGVIMDVSEVLTDRKVNIKSNCLLSYTAAKAKALCNGDVRLFVCAFVRLSRAGLLVLSLVTGVPYVSSTVKTHPPP